MYLGIDIGSTSSKAVVLSSFGVVIGQAVINSGTGSKGPQLAVDMALEEAGLKRNEIDYCVATGYGRLTFDGANGQITEISCHAKGVAALYKDARTIIDIGGQDAKIIRLSERRTVENFIMNEKCAAGTGRFLEVMSRVLDCEIGGLSNLAERGVPGIRISNTCTVFAESEVISQLAGGSSIADIATGVVESIAQRISGLSGRIGVLPTVVMTGGVAMNTAVVKAIEVEIGQQIHVPESPQIMGALGAAIYAKEKATAKGAEIWKLKK